MSILIGGNKVKRISGKTSHLDWLTINDSSIRSKIITIGRVTAILILSVLISYNENYVGASLVKIFLERLLPSLEPIVTSFTVYFLHRKKSGKKPKI